MYRNVGSAGRAHRSVGAARRGAFRPWWLSKKHKKAKHRVSAYQHRPEPAPRAPVQWPITVTSGPLVDGCLQVVTFNSRQEADRLGYTWVGR